MKTLNFFIAMAGLTGGLFAGAIVQAADNPAPAAPADATTTPAAPAAAATDAAAVGEPGLRINFRDVPLEQVLSYMSKAGGFVIHNDVSPIGNVTAWSDQPLSREEALKLVENILSEKGYAVIRDDRILTIVSQNEARTKGVPVVKYTRLDDIPKNAEVATYIIPVRTLNPIALLNNLTPLIGPGVNLQANESANSLLVTGSQTDIRRVADIVMQLDSVSSSINTIEVFPLKYADAKALADLVKQLFPSSDQSGGRGAGNPFVGIRGGGGRGGGRGGGGGAAAFGGLNALLGGGGGGTDPNGQTPTSRIAAVSDDHSNSLIVSAPEDLIPTIKDLVDKLDVPVEDVTEVHVFQLTNADATEMANTLTSLFPDPSGNDAGGQRIQLGGGNRGGRGGAGGLGGIAAPAAGGASSTSEYMQKLTHVSAVPDQRTQSIIVSASKDLMPQIADMITQLDANDQGKVAVYRIPLRNADPADVMQIIQDVFPQGSTSTRNTSQQNVLQTRATTVQQNMTSSGVGSGSVSTSTGGGTGGRVN